MNNRQKYISKQIKDSLKDFEEQMRKRDFEMHSRSIKRGLLARKLRLEMEKLADNSLKYR